jgi:hypothetical protein
MSDIARTGPQRKSDTLAMLGAVGADTWVATASPTGGAYLVPLSYAWDGERIVLAAIVTSPTVRNIRASGHARLGFGPTRDVVIVDAELDVILDVSEAPEELAITYARQSGWDPRGEPEPYVYALLQVRHVQAWREANELEGRRLMRDGEWLV